MIKEKSRQIIEEMVYISKNVKTSMGEMTIDVPRDRDGSFEPQIVPKRTKDISDIDKKVLSMYAKGMSQRDISNTIEDIYGFKISHDTISQITDCVLDELNEWQSRPLKKMLSICICRLYVCNHEIRI